MLPILAFYTYVRTALTSFSETLLPLGIALASVFAVHFLCWLVLKNARKAAMIACVFALCVLLYGYLEVLLGYIEVERHVPHVEAPLWLRSVVPVVVALFFVGVVWLTVTTKRNLYRLTTFLNIWAVALVLISGVNILINNAMRPEIASAQWDSSSDIKLVAAGDRPDIYYIILDEYPSAEVLRDALGYDNSDFIDFLSRSGFHVASQSKSNYIYSTLQSMASSLNMDYIENLAGQLNPLVTEDAQLLGIMISDTRIAEALASVGYSYVHYGGWFATMLRNPHADLNLNTTKVSFWQRSLMETTALRPLVPDTYRRQIRGAFDSLTEIPGLGDGPHFVFAHIVCPHEPYVFNADGEPIDPYTDAGSEEEPFLGQLEFVNDQMKLVVSEILSASDTEPIIIIQGDHGLRVRGTDGGALSESNVRKASGILNAIHLPDGRSDVLYGTQSPVNTFRIILNTYFGAGLELLEDRHFAFLAEID